ncbi:LysR family transcriptional regulator [Streptomyces sp. NPDC019443]|uniref:LysR family transcriptional regulator n=1 Tax=Streptomyces sp. NPDC019443 TaxID=3365061 RepID=UPI0037ADDA49
MPPYRASRHREDNLDPGLLRKALTSPYAWQRVERFLAASACPTIGEAARALGINQPTLVIQINRLERDLGQPLLERAERGRAMKLTASGKEVAAAAGNIRGQASGRVLKSEAGEGDDGAEQEGVPAHNR